MEGYKIVSRGRLGCEHQHNGDATVGKKTSDPGTRTRTKTEWSKPCTDAYFMSAGDIRVGNEKVAVISKYRVEFSYTYLVKLTIFARVRQVQVGAFYLFNCIEVHVALVAIR